MPGIAGIISPRPADQRQRLASAMVRCLQHEAFYTSGMYAQPNLGIYAGWAAHEKSFAARQIFFNEQRDIVLLVSGECFIDSSARTSLKRNGHKIADEGADWMVHLYEEENEHFFEALNGLFSGLLIDQRKRKIFLFNDRYG